MTAGTAVPPTGLTLNATLLRQDRQIAVINDRLYAIGDSLPATSPAGPRYTIAEVASDRVVLECLGEQFELHYADVSQSSKRSDGSPDARRSAAPAPKPAQPRKPRTK